MLRDQIVSLVLLFIIFLILACVPFETWQPTGKYRHNAENSKWFYAGCRQVVWYALEWLAYIIELFNGEWLENMWDGDL